MTLRGALARVLAQLALAAALLQPAGFAQAAPPAGWKTTGFAIDATDLRLRAVLEQFARVYDVRLSYSVKGDKVLKGRFKGDSGTEFLNRLAAAAPFRWFVYNDTLYVVAADDNASLRLDVGEDAVQDAKAALVGVGLYDERFGWGELPDTGTVIVSGPRAYVNLARDILMPDERRADAKARRVMMFRLKYASVNDRVINVRGQTETIPGVKTILSNLLFGPSSPGKLADVPELDAGSSKRSRLPKVGAGGAREVGHERGREGAGGSTFMPIFAPPAGTPPAAGRTSSEGHADRSEPRSRGEDERRPRIEANPALNAILIYDTADKRAMYAELIAQLDVQPQQIEIEALIVDIDRNRLAEMGVEWGVRAGAVNAVVNATATDSLGATLPVAGATLLISDAARFYARLKAMEANGEAKVLATPTVLTIDNVAAVLDLSQSAYVSLVGERVADLADVTAGTMLRVIPRIIREGPATRVHLEVDIEDGSLDNQAAGAKNSNVNVTRSTISTQAIIDSQQTLMIGGYRAERLSTDKQKVPVLGDLPLVGGLFRTENRSASTRERLFLLTPRLTSTAGTPAVATSKAAARGREAAREAGIASNLPPPPPSAPMGAPLLPLPAPAPVREKPALQAAERPGARRAEEARTACAGPHGSRSDAGAAARYPTAAGRPAGRHVAVGADSGRRLAGAGRSSAMSFVEKF